MNTEEYVVNELLNEKAKNEQLEQANIFLRQDYRDLKKKYDLIKSLFIVEQKSTNLGYDIMVNDLDGYFKGFIISTYHNNPADIEPQFMELLNALELTLPTPNNEDLESDQELVEQALEKAKELQENKENK